MFERITRTVNKFLSPAEINESAGLPYWREKISLSLIFFFFIFAIIAYIPSVYLSVLYEIWNIAIFDTIVYILLIVLFFNKKVAPRIKLIIMLAVSYVLGVVLILELGMTGAGYLWLFIIPLMASALLSGKTATGLLILNAVTMVVLGYVHYLGIYTSAAGLQFDLGGWLIITANFIFLNIVCTITIIVIIKGIEITVANEKRISESLEEQNLEVIKAKEQAERADRLKSDFLAQISHEIRTPLNTIINYTTLIWEDSSNQNKTYAGSIKNAAGRIIRTVELILNVSELRTENYNPVFRKFNVFNNVLSILLSQYKSLAIEKGLEFNIKNRADNFLIEGDEHAISQILANLMDNAVKFTEEGSVEVLIYNENEKLFIDILDSGIGISEEYLNEIFEPFSQEVTGYSRLYEGSGLGLSLVKQYCEINNIVLDIISKKSVGTIVKLEFKNVK